MGEEKWTEEEGGESHRHRRTSAVWSYYIRAKVGAGEEKKYVCNFPECGKVYAIRSSTTTLASHARTHGLALTPSKPEGQSNGKGKPEERGDDEVVRKTKVARIEKEVRQEKDVLDEKPTTGKSKRRKQEGTQLERRKGLFEEAVVDYFLQEGLPPEHVERDSFKALCLSIDRNARALRAIDVWEGVTQKARSLLPKALAQFTESASSRIALAVNTVNPFPQQRLIVVAARWIDRSWKMHSMLLAAKILPSAVSSDFVISTIRGCLAAWGVEEERVTSITVDGGREMVDAVGTVLRFLKRDESTASLDEIPKFVPCITDRVRRGADQALKMFDKEISSLRDVVFQLSSAMSLMDRLNSNGLGQNGSVGFPVLDDPADWLSTIEMIESAIRMRPALQALAEELNVVPISQSEWAVLEGAFALLRPARSVVQSNRSFKEVTIGLVCNSVGLMIEHFSKTWELEVVQSAAKQILDVINDSNPSLNSARTQAMRVLDPRVPSKSPSDIEALQFFLSAETGTVVSEEVTKQDEFPETMESAASFAEILGHSLGKSSSESHVDEISTFLRVTSELTRVPDALHWWKLHELQFPRLGALARSLLVTPSSSFLVGEFFSAAELFSKDEFLAERILLRSWAREL